MFNGQKTHITNKNEQKQNDDTSTMAAARNNDRSGNADIISGMRAAGRHHGPGVYRVLGHITPRNHQDLISLLDFFVALEKA